MPHLLITGANRGLGLEFVTQYAADGWSVTACCRNPAESLSLQKLAASNPSIKLEALDVADPASIQSLAHRLKDLAIDLLINNAGIYSGTKAKGVDAKEDNSQTFGTISAEAWDKVLRVNTIAPIMMTQAFISHIARSPNKKIVNITSMMGSIGTLAGGSIAYRSSKAALNAAMRTIVDDLKSHGVAVVNLHPGWVQTDMGGKQAPLLPQQSITGMRRVIAELSLQSTGQFLSYDGKAIPW